MIFSIQSKACRSALLRWPKPKTAFKLSGPSRPVSPTCSLQTSAGPSRYRPLPKQRKIMLRPINTHIYTPSLRASGEGSGFMELHLPPAKEHGAVVSTMETVCDILFCSNLTGRSATVETLQSFLMSFSFAATDKSSCWVYRMINLLREMILESEIGNSSQAQGSDGHRVFSHFVAPAGKVIHARSLFPTVQ